MKKNANVTDVVPSGVGWLDDNMVIGQSVVPLASITKHQTRLLTAGKFSSLPTLPYPQVYWSILKSLDLDGNQSFTIPFTPNEWIFDVAVSGDTIATSVVGLAVFESYNPATQSPTNLLKMLALKFSPKTTELVFERGLYMTQYAGKIMAVALAHYSVNPTCDISLSTFIMQDSLLETVVQPPIEQFQVSARYGQFGWTPIYPPPAGATFIGWILGTVFTCPDNATPLNIVADTYNWVPGSLSKCAIYDLAGNLICATAELEAPDISAGTLTTYPVIGAPVTLQAGAQYYLVVWGDVGVALRYSATFDKTVVAFAGSPPYGPAFPAVATFTFLDWGASVIYCNYIVYGSAPSVGTLPVPV